MSIVLRQYFSILLSAAQRDDYVRKADYERVTQEGFTIQTEFGTPDFRMYGVKSHRRVNMDLLVNSGQRPVLV